MFLIFAAFPGTEMSTIDVTRTYLEMTSPGDLRGSADPPNGVRIERVETCPVDLFRFLYAEVGKQFYWRDRLVWSDSQIEEYLKGPVWTWILYERGAPGGYFELKRHEDGSVEIAYFGLMPHTIGRGLGALLLTKAVEEAWKLSPTRVWLHTCTLDHPTALPNYVKRGFRPFRTEVYQTTIP
jgi:GNAT superfamily N-acetyltransferase